MREICKYGSMSGEWKRGKVRIVGHRQTKGPATVMLHLNYRATPRLYFRSTMNPRPAAARIAWWSWRTLCRRNPIPRSHQKEKGTQLVNYFFSAFFRAASPFPSQGSEISIR
jgi:hypothetical protein